ncbi:MAG TPA: LapA family protein [Gaiellaceae bacterium]|nr:LapA family protein [Gaiellaceae bacterium]
MSGDNEPTQPPSPASEPPAPEPHAAPEPESEAGHLATETEHAAEEHPRRFFAKVLALLFFVGYSVAFVVGNDKTIKVDFVFATAKVSLIWTILLLLSVGFVGGALAAHLYRQRRSKKPRQP